MTRTDGAVVEAEPSVPGRREAAGSPAFACPSCLSPVRPAGADTVACTEHGVFGRDGGIWRFVTEEGEARYRRFMDEYRTVRRAEGRGNEDSAWYRALPGGADGAGPPGDAWRVRARTYRTFVARVLGPLESRLGRPLAIVDLGAGNGWLSNRLAERGHEVLAVDLTDDARDGLGAWRHYGERPPFTPVQADYDRLPFRDGRADVAVFNASLHYSTDVAGTLAEALRVVCPEGTVVVLDTPVYQDPRSGSRMVAEREAFFTARYGFPSNALDSENYLTPDRIEQVAGDLGVRLEVHRPGESARRRLRRRTAFLPGRREPAAFPVLVLTPADGTAARPATPRRRRGRADLPPSLRRRKGPLAEAWRMLLRARYVLFQRGRHRGPSRERVAGLDLVVLPGVFNPALFRSGAFLAETLAEGRLVEGAATVLELGTGSGVGALVAARRGAEVVAVDVNPAAVACARDNAERNGLADRVDVRDGDLFAALRPDEVFDRILFNPPFFRGRPEGAEDAAWRSEDVPERFAAGLAGRLAPDGYALVVLSSDGGADAWLGAFRRAALTAREVARRDLVSELLVLYRVAPRVVRHGRGVPVSEDAAGSSADADPDRNGSRPS